MSTLEKAFDMLASETVAVACSRGAPSNPASIAAKSPMMRGARAFGLLYSTVDEIPFGPRDADIEEALIRDDATRQQSKRGNPMFGDSFPVST